MSAVDNDRLSVAETSIDLAHLLSGLEKQKDELGPIAEELLELLQPLGMNESSPENEGLSPSRG